MKTFTFKTFIFFILFVLLIFPSTSAYGVRVGIDILLRSLIPALLPFLLFSNYLLLSDTSYVVSDFFYPIFHKLFKTGKTGSYAILMGFLCGYPLGTKILCDLLKKECISKEEANYLFKFINNPSPAFLQGYILTQFNLTFYQRFILIVITYIPSIIIGIFLSYDYKQTYYFSGKSKYEIPLSKVIDDTVSNAFLTLTKIAGYLILFSIISVFIQSITIIPKFPKCIILCILEVTSGTHFLSSLTIHSSIKLLLAIAFSIFGGLSIIFQINSVTSDNSLNILELMKYKIISVLLFSLLYLLLYQYIF
ncbi:MAG: hypothetical protein IJA34_09620 [Lachnospiraceae bacterium]|nr:hypothetical protein [Lachnospiraceae bacterium]